MRDLAIRNLYPTVVTVRGGVEAWDQQGDPVVLDNAIVDAELARLLAVQATPLPDYEGFLVALDAQLTFAQINEMHRLYGMFVSWCQFENAPRIQECILDAQANHPDLMTPAVYALFQQAVTDYHIPVVLP